MEAIYLPIRSAELLISRSTTIFSTVQSVYKKVSPDQPVFRGGYLLAAETF